MLRQRFGARSVVGSAARDEMRVDSDIDIDILVEFDRPPSPDADFAMKDRLESVLGRSVDLVTPGGIELRSRRQVERDLLRNDEAAFDAVLFNLQVIGESRAKRGVFF